MSELVIRRAIKSDYEVIGQLLEGQLAMHRNGRPDIFGDGSGKYTYDDFCYLLEHPDSVIFTAVCGEKIAGYLMCQIKRPKNNPVLREIESFYLDDLCVAPDFRGSGVGKKLMEAAEEHAKSIGCHNVTLNVWEFNENAKEFYQHLGYQTQKRQMEKVIE